MKKAEVLAQCGTWLGPKNATTLAIKEALQDLDKWMECTNKRNESV